MRMVSQSAFERLTFFSGLLHCIALIFTVFAQLANQGKSCYPLAIGRLGLLRAGTCSCAQSSEPQIEYLTSETSIWV